MEQIKFRAAPMSREDAQNLGIGPIAWQMRAGNDKRYLQAHAVSAHNQDERAQVAHIAGSRVCSDWKEYITAGSRVQLLAGAK